MDKLKSAEDKLCAWLSTDPDHILDQCGDILSRNEFRMVEKQSSASDQMRVLLQTIIQKGEKTCESFFDILKQQQGHYPQLQQLFKPDTAGSSTPTMYADGSSIVTATKISNLKGKNVNWKIETVSDPGRSSCGNMVPQANLTARDGSIICADQISGITAGGDINFSVSVKRSQVQTGAVGETPSSSQGPTVKMIIAHKVELIDCLRADHSFILQHVHAKDVVTDRQYQDLRNISGPEKTVTNLLDNVIGRGEKSCSLFLEVLKKPDVLETYPQLKQILKKMC